MAEEESSGILETITLVFKCLRYTVVVLNSIVILFVLYFLFSAQNLGGEPLQMVTWLRVVYSLLVLVAAGFGILVALWEGKKTKFHLKMIATYLGAVLVLSLIAIILASVYVRHPSKYDIIFIVLSVFITFLACVCSISFGYALKKTKMLRRFNVLSLG